MLETGKTLQEVADALGDTVRVAEKHYNFWSKTRQERLDDAISDTWKNDPVLKLLDEQQNLAKLKSARVM
jgi:hypothetical protein